VRQLDLRKKQSRKKGRKLYEGKFASSNGQVTKGILNGLVKERDRR
jgi:hypothetical protein